MTTSMIDSLKEIYDLHIFFKQEHVYNLASIHYDNIHRFSLGKTFDLKDFLVIRKKIRTINAKVFITTFQDPRRILLLYAYSAFIPRIVSGYDHYNRVKNEKTPSHELDRYNWVLKDLDITIKKQVPNISNWNWEKFEWKFNFPMEDSIIFHIGPSAEEANISKNIPPDLIVSIINEIPADVREKVIIGIGSSHEKKIVQEVKTKTGSKINTLSGMLNISQLCYLISKSRLIVTSDSAPMHFALALQKKVLALFGPTDYRVTGPYGSRNNYLVLTSNMNCSPCAKYGRISCKENAKCMEAFDKNEVLKSFFNLLDR
ncbi:MAG: glycosyltransferase family 9 protein [Candidatus Coatesbacteria bacterium]|nr:glycosyltransferase family 9 protein [Candidatus Coatesbacteria bacterium]